MDKETLANIFHKYHRKKGRYNFLYAGKERANLIRNLVGKGKYLLDLGCRDGTLTNHFVEENRVIGLDIDKEALSICKDKLGIETVWHNANERLPFEDSLFDVVVAGELLDHIYSPHLLIKEIRRTLKNDGYFIGSIPNALYIKNRLKFLIGSIDTDLLCLHKFALYSLNCLLKSYFSTCLIFPIAGGRNLPKFIINRLIKVSPSLWAIDFVFSCRGKKEDNENYEK